LDNFGYINIKKEDNMITRKEALEDSRDRWYKRSRGEEVGGIECGFCTWTKQQFDSLGGCEKLCPMYSANICRPDSPDNPYHKWRADPTKENAMKVLEGVLRRGIPWSEEEDYKITYYKMGARSSILDCYSSGEPRPAPKEEWVDVTKECVHEISGYSEWCSVTWVHNGHLICSMGTALHIESGKPDDYRVEFISNEFQGGFRILHKQEVK